MWRLEPILPSIGVDSVLLDRRRNENRQSCSAWTQCENREALYSVRSWESLAALRLEISWFSEVELEPQALDDRQGSSWRMFGRFYQSAGKSVSGARAIPLNAYQRITVVQRKLPELFQRVRRLESQLGKTN